MVEVGAKAALLHFAAQVAVGGRDDPAARGASLRLADPLVLAVFQHAQQLRLQVERQLADLIEQQRAVGRILEITGLVAGGAGEGALHVAEKGRLDERRRDRGAIEGEVRTLRARREPVQAPRRHLLAAARFAFDQHGVGRRRELGDLIFQLGERRAFADQRHIAARRGRQRARQHALELRRIARLGDELPGAERARVARIGGVVLPREHEDLHLRRVRQQIGDQLEALVGRMRGRRQAEVDERERRRGLQRAHQVDRRGARGARVHGVMDAEGEAQRLGDERVVVDQQQGRARLREALRR